MQREPEIHRLDRVAERPRAGQIHHVAPAEQMDRSAVRQMPGRDGIVVVLHPHHGFGRLDCIHGDLPRQMPGVRKHGPVLQE